MFTAFVSGHRVEAEDDKQTRTEIKMVSIKSGAKRIVQTAMGLGAVVMLATIASPQQAMAQKADSCQAAFNAEKTKIEALAGTPNANARIKEVLRARGCRNATVFVNKTGLPKDAAAKARIRWHCDASAPPFKIKCSFGNA